MLFDDVKKAMMHFSPEQLRQLREYIEDQERKIVLRPATVNMDDLLIALADIREGLTQEDFAEIERAMNEEYIEPLDDEV